MNSISSSIEHVVVLMLENRSFDHLLGSLHHPDPSFTRTIDMPGLVNLENPDDPTSPGWVFSDHGKPFAPLDPDHAHSAVMHQLGIRDGQSGDPSNSGFVRSYLHKAGDGLILASKKVGVELGAVMMGGLTEEWTPALSRLAKDFALCTCWFSSVPGETWPNRNFVHAATSDGAVDIELGLYTDPTIFEQLEDSNHDPSSLRKAWRIYYDGPPQALAFRNLWTKARLENCWRTFGNFASDVENDRLPRYSFIEPNHNLPGANLLDPVSNSQHPGNNKVPVTEYGRRRSPTPDFFCGDQLIADVYRALRSNEEVFRKTMLVITYDEHGGWYDHVAPPPATPPGDPRNGGLLNNLLRHLFHRKENTFPFDRLGVRVPAVIVSPWIPRGLVCDRVLEHASVPATLRKLFVPKAPALTRRDAAANSFLDVLKLEQPRNEEDMPSPDDLLSDYPVGPSSSASESGDAFQRSLAALALLARDALDQPVDTPIEQLLQAPVALLASRAPLPTISEQVSDAMRRFQERSEGG